MPTFRFDVRVNNIPLALLRLDEACKKTVEGIGDAIVKHVKNRVPVDTGALRDSYMRDVVDNRHVRVGSPMEYAP